ncbi:MAG: M3 family oligoendopeptidase [Lachnospiraceae bacterium]|nr:M3 family oligoendopeptidase [Lachnospiraceae bacterium]
MNKEWALDVIYKSYDDPAYQQDMETLKTLIGGLETEMKSYQQLEPKEGLEKSILLMEKLTGYAEKLGNYISLSQSVNTTDSRTNNEMAIFDKVATGSTRGEVVFRKYVASIENLDEVIQSSDLLKEYEYMLKETKKAASHLFSDDMEEMIAKMNLTGGSAWSNLFSYLTSTVKVDYEGRTVNLPTIRNLAYSGDRAVRKAAYEAELAAYDKIADSIAFALNNIKSQVTMLTEARGYASPLDMTLEQNHMKRETLEAMLTAMKEYLPKFWEYLKAKAHYLGHEGSMPWYDMFAPVGSMEKEYTAEEAGELLVNSFSEFSQDMADMMAAAFADRWIDFLPHEGKVGGAFCAGVSCLKESRILTNFNGSFDAIITLAHELGHAYHNLHTFSHRALNRDYSMPVAETASTFNETVITMNAIRKAQSREEKLALIETILMGTTQIICDIYSRFLFEDRVFAACSSQFLMSGDLKEIMLGAQKEAYGDGLDHEFLHPYMWTCKSHYYSAGLSYYNFPYAFGGLFAMGLYSIYQKEGESFVPKYQALLHATPVMSVEDVAKMADIDLTSPDFWRESLKAFGELIDEFVELAQA